MKRADKSTGKSFNELVSMLSGNEILTTGQMLKIRGGDPDGNGSNPIILPPPTKPV
jgi:hypothetical protein